MTHAPLTCPFSPRSILQIPCNLIIPFVHFLLKYFSSTKICKFLKFPPLSFQKFQRVSLIEAARALALEEAMFVVADFFAAKAAASVGVNISGATSTFAVRPNATHSGG